MSILKSIFGDRAAKAAATQTPATPAPETAATTNVQTPPARSAANPSTQESSAMPPEASTTTTVVETAAAATAAEKAAAAGAALAAKPATIGELKTAFPDDPALCLECAEKQLTIEQAKGVAFDRLKAKVAADQEAAAKKLEQEKALGNHGKGSDTIPFTPGAGGTSANGSTGLAKQRWPQFAARHTPFYDAVAARLDSEKCKEHEAVAWVMKNKPELQGARIGGNVAKA